MRGERVAQLELILRGHPEGLRKSDIARRIGVHRSTIGRYIEELKQYSDIYEDKNLVKILPKEGEEPISLSMYESLALNMGAELLLTNSEYTNPHLASGLRKIAMGMQNYAPKISANIVQLADEIQNEATKKEAMFHSNSILDSLIDAWVSGKIVRIIHSPKIHPEASVDKLPPDEETELAPYFIGYVESETGRNPMTVTGRLRHTSEIVTIDIGTIKEVTILNETYTIPDNLKAFRKKEYPADTGEVVDLIHLELLVRQKSALNSFDSLSHGKIDMEKMEDGTLKCTFDAENSIELILRIIQCGTAVEVLGPAPFKSRFVNYLSNILDMYKNR
jgi:predicted DNA-binding transcriptional regulator YafY